MNPAAVDTDVLYACEVAVLRALEVAGKRGRTRHHRSMLADVPVHELHVFLRLATTDEGCDRFLTGAWDHLALVIPDHPRLYSVLDWYTRQLIVQRRPHTRDELRRVLAVVYE